MAQSADPSFAHMGGLGSNAMPLPRRRRIHINEDAAWLAVMGRGDASGPSYAETTASSVLSGNGTEDESADVVTDSASSYQDSVFSGHAERLGGYASSIMQPSHGSQVRQDQNAAWWAAMPGENSSARYYAQSIAFSDCTGDGLEDARRPRFQPSLDGESVADSYAQQDSVFSGRGGRGGGHGSVFSSEHDGKTKASRTTAFSAVQRAMNNALADPSMEIDDDHATLVPPVVIAETGAGADIADPDHWNQLGVTPAPTGIHASSASAMAFWTGPASVRSAAAAAAAASSASSTDATEIVAHLPCEFRRYKACMDTFPLYRSGAGIDAWTDHMVRTRTHLYHRLPRASGCWFCSETFSVGEQHHADRAVITEVYKKRMRHIARHYLSGHVRDSAVAPATPPRDAAFERHLIDNGVWKPASGEGGDAQQGPARVPTSNDLRDPIRDYTVGTRTTRSARSDARYVTAGRREIAHHQ
ncbi:hypothetical protein MY11210_002126 [Beauveria gryllotalpidicola]